MEYAVYIVRCADGTFYTGVATDAARRIAEHNGQGRKGARYTAPRRPVRLVYEARFPSRSAAQQEEARIKRLPRAEKERMVLSHESGPAANGRALS